MNQHPKVATASGLIFVVLLIIIVVIWLKNQDTRVKPHSSAAITHIVRA